MDLGLGDSEFWSQTPRETFALLARREAMERRMDLRFGALMATVANFSGNLKKGAKPLKATDFVGGEREAKPKRVQSDEEMFSTLLTWYKAWGGKDPEQAEAK